MTETETIFIDGTSSFHLSAVDRFSLSPSGQLDVYLKSGVTISTRFLSGKRGGFIAGTKQGDGLTAGERLMNALSATRDENEKEDTDD